jgi:hypothetical protein
MDALEDPVTLVLDTLARLPQPAECGTRDFDVLFDLAHGLTMVSRRAIRHSLAVACAIDAVPDDAVTLGELMVEQTRANIALERADEARTWFAIYANEAERTCGADFHEPATPLDSGRLL